MVMCHNGKSMGHIATCLDELIGKEDAIAFAKWFVNSRSADLSICCALSWLIDVCSNLYLVAIQLLLGSRHGVNAHISKPGSVNYFNNTTHKPRLQTKNPTMSRSHTSPHHHPPFTPTSKTRRTARSQTMDSNRRKTTIWTSRYDKFDARDCFSCQTYEPPPYIQTRVCKTHAGSRGG